MRPPPAGLLLSQPATGYRFSLDPFLLASFVRPRPRERVIDLGAGVGVIALLIARRHPSVRTVAVEIQHDLARHALENARSCGLEGRSLVIRGDARNAPSFLPPGSFDRVVANPPYRAAGTGRPSPHPSRALARQELSFSLADLARAAAALLRHGGTLDIIHLAERIPEIFRMLAAQALEPKHLRLIVPSPGSPPRLCLISARKGGRPGLTLLPQLVVRGATGRYSREVANSLNCARGGPSVRGKKSQTSG